MMDPALQEQIMLGVAWYAVFLLSLTLHEAAHAFAALRLGDPTAYHGGQVTLNPVPHIRRSPFGTVIVPLLVFATSGWMIGWASAPYDPVWARRYPRREAIMALAGPLANLLLVLLAGTAIVLGLAMGWFVAPQSVTFGMLTEAASPGLASGAAMVLSILFGLNLLLFVFNLIPLPPLDGSSVITLLMPEETAMRYRDFLAGQPGLALVGLLIAWRLFNPVFDRVFLIALKLLYPGVDYQ
ncbi:MAG: site-2 protease family protein [Acidobacteriota bacterium]